MNQLDGNSPIDSREKKVGRQNVDSADDEIQVASWRNKIHEVIFEADTFTGKLFDVVLLILIVISIVAISMETVREFSNRYGSLLETTEWVITILFTIEYVLRIICVRRPLRYVFSFYGIVDLVSILPTYLAMFDPASATSSFAVVRALRLLRIVRVFKLVSLIREADTLYRAMWESRGKVLVFFGTVLITVCIMGTLMYVIEHDKGGGFTSIPQSMYWAVVTMTTVGYGDIVPRTPLGKLMSASLILIGYSLIIVPTGFVSAEFVAKSKPVSTQVCTSCMREGHDWDAKCCKYCGEKL